MQFTMLISTIKKYRILPRVATKTKNTDNYEIKLEVLIKKIITNREDKFRKKTFELVLTENH